jgi:hypothetical protein
VRSRSSALLAPLSKSFASRALGAPVPQTWRRLGRRESGSPAAGPMTTMGRACCSAGCRLPVCTPSLPCRPPKYSLTLCSLLLPCRALAVKSLITKMLNQQPRMRVNALFNYLVEMDSVSLLVRHQVLLGRSGPDARVWLASGASLCRRAPTASPPRQACRGPPTNLATVVSTITAACSGRATHTRGRAS